MALYTETVMDHFMHPRNVGEIADADGDLRHRLGDPPPLSGLRDHPLYRREAAGPPKLSGLL